MKKTFYIPNTNKPLIIINCLFLIFIGWKCNTINAQEKQLKFRHLTTDEGLSQNTIHGIVKDKYGFMWFGTWEGISIYDGYNFKKFRANENDPSSLSNNRINLIYKDLNQNIWISTGDNEICKYNYETENFTRYTNTTIPKELIAGLSQNYNNQNSAQNKNYTWHISNAKLVQTDKQSGKQVQYSKDLFDNWSLNDNNLTCIYIDDCGILWIGTENGGINMSDTYANTFENFNHSPISINSLIDNKIRAICEDKSNNIWVGTLNNGITILNTKKNTFHHLQTQIDNKNSIISNEIRSLYSDRFGYIWIGTKNGLTRYYPKTGQCNNYSVSGKKQIPHNWVFSIMEDHAGYLWIGTFNGIAKYNRKTDQFLGYPPNPLLKSKNVRAILEDHHYNLWIATEGGGITLLKRDSSEGFQEKLTPVKHFTYEPSKQNSLVNNVILAMAEDEYGILWVGTNNGICQISTNSLSVITNNSIKLPDNLIMGIVCDQHGYVWISHKKGLTRLNIKNFTLRNFTKTDGLQGNEFNQNAFFKSKKNNKIFFGGTNGLTAFNSQQIKNNPYYPEVVITSLQINNNLVLINKKVKGQIILNKSLLETKQIKLINSENTINIGFTALHYTNSPENKYQYKLEGFDKNWLYTESTNRLANYSNLSPGKYIFQIRAANCDGIWNPKPTCLSITILPPWWRTQFAYILYSLVLIIIVTIILLKLSNRKNSNNNSHFLMPNYKQKTAIIPHTNEISPIVKNFSFDLIEDTFVKKAIEIVKANITDTNFSTEGLSQKLNISQRQLYRKIKELTGLTVHDFITNIRLQVAANLLLSGNFSISEVAYKVGYTEPANFSRTFTKNFGKTPSSFLKDSKNVQ